MKCITFDKEAQVNLPEHVKQKMTASREKARAEVREYVCVNCKHINLRRDNKQIRVGFCSNCGHPLWNSADEVK